MYTVGSVGAKRIHVCIIIFNRYTGELSDEAGLKGAVEGQDGGARCPAYTSLVAWVTGELRVLGNLEEMVNATHSADEHSSFLMEVSSFLKELGGSHEIFV